MFRTLEVSWDRSGRRGWTTVASFSLQILALSLLLLIPMFTVQGPIRVAWFNPRFLAPPPAAPAPEVVRVGGRAPMHPSNVSGVRFVAPASIPSTIARVNDVGVEPAPELIGVGVRGGTGRAGSGIIGSVGDPLQASPPPQPPLPTRRLRVSHLDEGNLVSHVPPVYPQLARLARVQGVVELRAVVSKTGVIENLSVVSGQSMLVKAAEEAVRQWRYRPYMLNGEPVEVETDITVNFRLGGD